MRLRTGGLLAIVLCFVALSHPLSAQTAPAGTAKPEAPGALPLTQQTWRGDLDGMLERRVIRVLVPYSKTFYYVVRGEPRGISYESLKEFESFVNKKFPPKTKNLPTRVVFIPCPRDEIFSRLNAGRADVSAAGLTVTDERKKLVDFTE